jgi:hypothetical protein
MDVSNSKAFLSNPRKDTEEDIAVSLGSRRVPCFDWVGVDAEHRVRLSRFSTFCSLESRRVVVLLIPTCNYLHFIWLLLAASPMKSVQVAIAARRHNS